MAFKMSSKYRGWLLVETGHRYYHAINGKVRLVVGMLKHSDREDLYRRFKQVVDDFERIGNESEG